jgi:hypothetical protein
MRIASVRVKTHLQRGGAERSGQQLVIQFVETKRSIYFHELNHKLLAAPLYVCFYTYSPDIFRRVYRIAKGDY